MSLKEQLTEDMKTAMKAKEEGKQRLSVIRMVRSAIKQIEIDGKKVYSYAVRILNGDGRCFKKWHWKQFLP